MLTYRCEHCNAYLGTFAPEDPEPRCEIYPDGAVSCVEAEVVDTEPQ